MQMKIQATYPANFVAKAGCDKKYNQICAEYKSFYSGYLRIFLFVSNSCYLYSVVNTLQSKCSAQFNALHANRQLRQDMHSNDLEPYLRERGLKGLN